MFCISSSHQDWNTNTNEPSGDGQCAEVDLIAKWNDRPCNGTIPALFCNGPQTEMPSVYPTNNPTNNPTSLTSQPTNNPSINPTINPTSNPSTMPTYNPTTSPTVTQCYTGNYTIYSEFLNMLNFHFCVM